MPEAQKLIRLPVAVLVKVETQAGMTELTGVLPMMAAICAAVAQPTVPGAPAEGNRVMRLLSSGLKASICAEAAVAPPR